MMASPENSSGKEGSIEDAQLGFNAIESEFIVDDGDKGINVVSESDDGNESDEETVLFDYVCAICDNGGELLCCEGRCIRSFHPTVESGEDSTCNSLGFSMIQVEAIQNFMCLNCQHKMHQCFACGKLGSSDRSSVPEVFQCVSATCSYFYHPECVAKLLHPNDEGEAKELEDKIWGGEQFTCPAHECHVCRQREQTDILELQFAVCRRCPKAYHRKCLPRKITFGASGDDDVITRAWDGLLPHNRVLIYCLKHKIDETLGTPPRNHIRFPDFEEKKKRLRLEALSRRRKAVAESRSVKQSICVTRREEAFSEKPIKPDACRKPSWDSTKDGKSSAVDRRNESRREEPPVKVDAETIKRIKAMMVENASLVKVEDIVKAHRIPSVYASSSNTVVDKSITIGKVEGFVEAARTALENLEKGGSVEDAKAVCGPEIINLLIRWKSKLGVYLSPFLHGARYTSFGRHFTKVEKLQEIVEKLHWYTQPGDMIVDFCCGANDFSRLMKQKLEETGKECSFKNYDIIQPKNDFCFEKKDWMTVSPGELPVGSNLIMGLNPPFGVKAALANKFIDKALKFQPKILILIVPPETERLDKKKPAYDLVWEDNLQLSGKSFYLPGSVDTHDNQIEQWNITPPPLYLWSRPDWTTKHKTIAMEKGHIREEHISSYFKNHSTHSLSHCKQLPLPPQDVGGFSRDGSQYSSSYGFQGVTPESSYGMVNLSSGSSTLNGQNFEWATGVSSGIHLLGDDIMLNNMTSHNPFGSLPSIHPNMKSHCPYGSRPSIHPNMTSQYPYAPGIPRPSQQPPGSLPSIHPNMTSQYPSYAPGIPRPSQQPLPSIHPNMTSQYPSYVPGIPRPSQQPPGFLPSFHPYTYAPGIADPSEQPPPPGIYTNTSAYAPGIADPSEQPPPPGIYTNTSAYAPGIADPSEQPPPPGIYTNTSAYAPGMADPSEQPPPPGIYTNTSAYASGIPHPSQQPPGYHHILHPDMSAFAPFPSDHSHQSSSEWFKQ